MYLQFFGLTEAPFSITPDPAFVYLSAAHREALAHLLYGIGQGGAGGFVQLTGEVGTGKTTLCRCLLEQVPDETRVALILNPLVTPTELLAGICEELGIDLSGVEHSRKNLIDVLNRYLLEEHSAGRRVVLVIDEAQNLSPEALEQVRLLTNLETAKEKLLQIILLGQPELRELLKRKSLRQLAQRITARYHLAPLSRNESMAYVRHRMKVAGASTNPFNRAALRALYRRSEGIPRLINIIADRALVGAFAEETTTIGPRLINAAANEVQPSESRVQSSQWRGLVATAASLVLLIVTLGLVGLPEWPGRDAGPVSSAPSGSAGAENSPAGPSDSSVQAAAPAAADAADPPVTAAATAAEPESPVLPAELDADWLASQHERAWQAMAELWMDRDAATSIREACEGATGRGYSCLRDYGSWSRVRQLGLPVILVLQGEPGRLLLLRGMTEEGLLVGDSLSMVEVSRDAVESRWLGEFMLPWPQAKNWPAEVKRGEEGPAVDIVLEMATFAEPPWTGGDEFDEQFESWLVAFQRRNGLKADGIVGRVTMLYLLAPTISQPRLITESEENS